MGSGQTCQHSPALCPFWVKVEKLIINSELLIYHSKIDLLTNLQLTCKMNKCNNMCLKL